MTGTLTNAMLLAAAIIKFLEAEAETMPGNDKKEGLQVAASCIKHSFGVTDQVLASPKLPNLYDLRSGPTAAASVAPGDASAPASTPQRPRPTITPQMREQAERHKQVGNRYLAEKRATQAAEEYTRALELDPENAVYYCNRAAALTMAGEYEGAIEDCKAALSINPKYAKAYSRLGAAYSAVNNWELAVDAYQKAVDLEPDNSTYQASLRQAQLKIRPSATPSPQSQPRSPSSGFGGGLDFVSLMNNPEIMQMASRLMQDPNALQNMMRGNPQMAAVMQGMMGGGNNGGATGANRHQARDTNGGDDTDDES